MVLLSWVVMRSDENKHVGGLAQCLASKSSHGVTQGIRGEADVGTRPTSPAGLFWLSGLGLLLGSDLRKAWGRGSGGRQYL